VLLNKLGQSIDSTPDSIYLEHYAIVESNCDLVRDPCLKIDNSGPVQSTTVEGVPPGVRPPSMISGIRPLSCSKTSCAVIVLGLPERFAELTARGPTRLSNSSANGWSGIRTPILLEGERIAGSVEDRGITKVNAPGQKCSAKRLAVSLISDVTWVKKLMSPINTAIAFDESLPLTAYKRSIA